ncbi:MAG: thermonuclease family protein [Xanthobacteraceae bacterium]|uniref:thermonuclease family protein n=1 Tax=Pseudolabrys sp. TaxID=1960880 RepID=UPI003D1133F0
MFLTAKSQGSTARQGALLFAAAAFAAGLCAGFGSGVWLTPRLADSAVAAAPASTPAMPSTLRSGHPAQVLKVIDGDTFEARVAVWPGMEITTKVRLRGIDAPEMSARCEDEYRRAVIARDALARMLAEGDVGISRIGQDKYGGRVDAEVSTRATRDVAAQLLAAGAVRRYEGGRRRGWCG